MVKTERSIHCWYLQGPDCITDNDHRLLPQMLPFLLNCGWLMTLAHSAHVSALQIIFENYLFYSMLLVAPTFCAFRFIAEYLV